MFLLLEKIIGEHNKIESKSRLRGKLFLQDFFVVFDYFISNKSYFT